MNKLCITAAFCISLALSLLASTSHEKRLDNLACALQKGDLPTLDELLKANYYSSSEIDLLVVKTEDIMSEAKNWGFAVWIIMNTSGVLQLWTPDRGQRWMQKSIFLQCRMSEKRLVTAQGKVAPYHGAT